MKYALLPGVYVGELGLTGFVGAAVKGPLKRRVAQVEAMVMQGVSAQAAANPAYQQSAQGASAYCQYCGGQLKPGAAFCENCGSAV